MKTIRKYAIAALLIALLVYTTTIQSYACTAEILDESQLNYTQLSFVGVTVSEEDNSYFTVLSLEFNYRDEFRNATITGQIDFDYFGSMENLEVFQNSTYFYDYQYNVLKIVDIDGVEWYNDLNL